MPCCGGREKLGKLRAEQKWDYINLDEFKSESWLTPLSYVVLFIMVIISTAVYAVDTFTAVQLLVFDRWASEIKPAIPLNISRWIFTACILLSFVLLFYRWLRAIRVMRQGGVAQSYLDPLAVRIQSIRPGKTGRGWKRFLVFAQLTKGKKGADYVALFSYFSFEAWMRVVLASGPRQVVNALTLYSVINAQLLPTGKHAAKDGRSDVQQFFANIETLMNNDRLQGIILFGMLFTLIIWVFKSINLIVAVVLYIFFLWHHIPSSDGGLGKYCRRQINRRMEQIVQAKVAKSLKQENAMRARQEAKDAKEGKTGARKPTLPSLDVDEEKTPEMPLLSRTTTQTTLPPYESERADSMHSIGSDLGSRTATLPDLTGRPMGPSRIATDASTASSSSYASNAPLMGGAGAMGYGGRPASPGPGPGGYGARPTTPMSPLSQEGRAMPPGRSLTGLSQFSQSSQASQRSYPGPPRPPTGQGRPGPTPYRGPPMNGPGGMQQQPNSYPMNPMPRPGTAGSMRPPPSVGRSTPGPSPMDGRNSPMTVGRSTPGPSPMDGRNSPMMRPNPMGPQRSASPAWRGPPSSQSLPGSGGPGYVPFNPQMRSESPSQGPPRGPPQRSVTQPNISSGAPTYFSAPGRAAPPRSPTAPLPPQSNQSQGGGGGYDDILNSY